MAPPASGIMFKIQGQIVAVISPAVPFWQVLGSHLQGQPILLGKLHSPQAR